MKHPYLVTIDNSLASERAMSYAVAQALYEERSLVFVHVIEAIDRCEGDIDAHKALLFLGSTTMGVLNRFDRPVVMLPYGHAFEVPVAKDRSKTVVSEDARER